MTACRYAKTLVALVAATSALTAFSQDIDMSRRETYTPSELALLPEYCDSVQRTPNYTGPRGDHWRRLIGVEFMHMHHYCLGLRDQNYAKLTAIPAAQKNFLWNRSLNEFAYVERNSRPDRFYMPELYYSSGIANLALRRYDDASAAFEAARKLKPDYVPAYTAWADKLIELKLYARAKALLQEGLQHLPDDPQLTARLAAIDGGSSADRKPVPRSPASPQ